MALAVHVHPSRFAQTPGRCWDLSVAVSQLGKLAAGAVGGVWRLPWPLHPQRCLGLAAGEEAVALAVLLCHLVGCWPCSPGGKIPSGAGDTNTAPCNTPARPKFYISQDSGRITPLISWQLLPHSWGKGTRGQVPSGRTRQGPASPALPILR